MGFRVITDMALADQYWKEGLLYYRDKEDSQSDWELDTYNVLDVATDWRPSADVERDDLYNEYAIFVED